MTPASLQRYLGEVAAHALGTEQPLAVLRALEKQIIEGALALEAHNQCHVARWLGLHRNTVTRKMITLGIPRRRQL